MNIVNEITRVIIVILALAVFVRWVIQFRRRGSRPILSVLFPLAWSVQILLFFIFQRSGQVDPLLLNWFSQLIRVQALIYLLAV